MSIGYKCFHPCSTANQSVVIKSGYVIEDNFHTLWIDVMMSGQKVGTLLYIKLHKEIEIWKAVYLIQYS